MDTSRQEVTKWKQSKRELEAQVDELKFLLQKAETVLRRFLGIFYLLIVNLETSDSVRRIQ